MTARIFLKLTAVIGCLIAVALISADVLASRSAEDYYVEHLRSELFEKGKMLVLSQSPMNLDQRQIRTLADATGARLAVVTRDGKVLADSDGQVEEMENHSDAPELQQAFSGKMGSARRLSGTVGVPFLYVALPLPNGALRLGMPISAVDAEVKEIRNKILQSVALAFLPAVLLAAFLARRLASRLSAIIAYAGELARANFKARLPASQRGELGLLTVKLNETGAKLEQTVQQVETEHAELERLERVRKDFVINVSHELRTPLASILGYTETLIDGAIYDTQNNVRFLDIIKHNAERLTRLTGDLLTLSRLQLHTQEFRFASFRVNDLLADVVDTIRPIAQKKHLYLRHQRGPTGCEVFCDSEAFYQIVSNLLDNAVKYTPEGGSITAGSRPVTGENGARLMEFFIRDTGIGIPVEEQSRLFERFYRVDKARSRELGGTGLGLAIVKHLVRAQGGEARVESKPGTGSTFFFTLPEEHTDLPMLPEAEEELTPF